MTKDHHTLDETNKSLQKFMYSNAEALLGKGVLRFRKKICPDDDFVKHQKYDVVHHFCRSCSRFQF